MSNKKYVDNFEAPLYAALDKAKDELVEQLKSKLVSEMDSNEALRLNLEKSEEQRKIAVEKNVTLEAKIRSLEVNMGDYENIKLLRDNYDREKVVQQLCVKRNYAIANDTIRMLRKENAKLIHEQKQIQSPENTPGTMSGNKRRRNQYDETSSIESRVLKPRNSNGGLVQSTSTSISSSDSSSALVEHLRSSERMVDSIRSLKNKMFPSENQKEQCEVFGIGAINKSHLGHLGIKDGKEAKPVKLDFVDVDFVDAGTKTCTFSNGNLFMNGVQQKRITTGAKFATSFGYGSGSHYVIDAVGDLWSWGSNSFGQLGHGDSKKRTTPKLVEALKGKRVKEISTSYFGCVACITDTNTCYVWGGCSLLTGKEESRYPVRLDRAIKSIAVGNWHALMIDTEGDVYAIGDTKKHSSWTKLNTLTGRTIKVQCGQSSSAVLTTTGLYTMGNRLGSETPQLVELTNVADVSMKSNLIVALTSNGELYAWGDYFYGMHGKDKPVRVYGLEAYHIRQMSAGDGYCLLRCAPKSE